MTEIRVKKLKSFKEKTLGLIFAKSAYPALIETRFGIHTFGLRFPIDVLILDNLNRVMLIRRSLKPNRIFVWNPKFKKVIELPSGEIEKKKIDKKETIALAV